MEETNYLIGNYKGKNKTYYCESLGNLDIVDNNFIHFYGLPKFANTDLENSNLKTMELSTKALNSGIIFKLNLEDGSFNKEILRRAINNNLTSIIFIKKL